MYEFSGPLPIDQDKASRVTIRGECASWCWQHWEENKVQPPTVFRIRDCKKWWTQDSAKCRGPVVIEGIAFDAPECTVFSFGDFANQEGRGADARGNALRFCSFHGTPFVGPYFVRGIRQYNFEVDHCSFRGGCGIELSGDMPTLSHLRMGMHTIGIRTFDVGGHSHVPGTISDVEIEGVSGTGIVTIGDNLERCSVEVGYGFTPESGDRKPGRVVRFDREYAVLDGDGWLSDDDKCPASYVDPTEAELVPQVPAVIAGNRCCVTDCRFESNRAGLDTPQFVVVPDRSPIRINGVPELYGLGRETTNRPVVAAWCAGNQHCLFGQVLTDHLQLSHPLVNTRHAFDPNWGADVGAANDESKTLRFRLRDGKWVRRLSDSPSGWTHREEPGPGLLYTRLWAREDGLTLYVWDGTDTIQIPVKAGWQRIEQRVDVSPLGRVNLRGDGIEAVGFSVSERQFPQQMFNVKTYDDEGRK